MWETTGSDLPWYEPPEFTLYEAAPYHRNGLRSFDSWNGLLGEKADQVTLTWTVQTNVTLVVSRTHTDDLFANRLDVVLSLGLLKAHRGEGKEYLPDEAFAISDKEGLWRDTQVFVDGNPLRATMLDLDERYFAGCCTTDSTLVGFVSSFEPVEIALRSLTSQSSAVYDRDPLKRHAVEDFEPGPGEDPN